jgi:hypothetical protein
MHTIDVVNNICVIQHRKSEIVDLGRAREKTRLANAYLVKRNDHYQQTQMKIASKAVSPMQ